MRLNGQTLTSEGTLPGKKIRMSIEATAVPLIMDAMTNLYENAHLAIIREYSTNARDSHVEAGCPERPIEVTLPKSLSPNLVIRDYGVGLDADDIEQIYSRYGASTKRDTNDAIGMLGFGCKSGLAYAQQFTLSGIKGGVRTEVAVSKSEDGGGDMTPVTSYESEDEQGVEIVIPVPPYDFEKIAKTAAEFFRFWPEGSVLVDGVPPKRIDGMWLSDDLLLTKEALGLTVVMGGVPYPEINSYGDTWDKDRYGLVAFVGIGDVAFVPSREALKLNDPQTKAKIQEILQREKVEKQAALLALVAEAPDAPEAARIAKEARKIGLKEEAVWQGKPVPDALKLEGAKLTVGSVVRKDRDKGFGEVRSIPNGTPTFWLGGFPNPKFTPYKRQKLDQWWRKNRDRLVPEGEAAPVDFVIAPEVPQEIRDWIPEGRILPWAQVEAEKISKPKQEREDADGRPKKPQGTYPAYSGGGGRGDHDPADVPVDKLFYYVGSAAWNAYRHDDVDQILRSVEGAFVFVLAQNRLPKFLRDNPAAREISAFVKAQAEDWLDSLTDDDLLALSMNGNTPGIIRDLDVSRVDDPELAKVAAAAARHDEVQALRSAYSRWVRPEVPKPHDVSVKYPLMDGLDFHHFHGRTPHDHVYLYINAAHAAREEQTV